VSLHSGASFKYLKSRFPLTVMEELKICFVLEVKTESVLRED
jgi:hypothetical protein